ncbi:molybdate ABC transporter permease subunit [Campylobacter sp. FMV-PI01]|uniref:Molybdenum transport system permease n=2 Tax=Campylobacter portucalensis TaxID=2608384 RepID=A0A6L5WJP2_9BACT|nr:molybdate ABC transporter permease subunit [Campylobacter portucalensis]
MDFTPFMISFKLAFLTTAILFFITIPLAWVLSQSSSKFKPLIQSVCTLPIVVPPTVMGFYILLAFSKNSFLGKFLHDNFGLDLVFSFEGILFASCIYSLPFMFGPLLSGFESLNKNMIEASYLCGKGRLKTITQIALPNIKPSILTAIVITFAHCIGEFGIILMVGGSIEKQTKVASIAVYEFVEILDYKSAHIYSLIMLGMSFLVLFGVYAFNQKQKNKFSEKNDRI